MAVETIGNVFDRDRSVQLVDPCIIFCVWNSLLFKGELLKVHLYNDNLLSVANIGVHRPSLGAKKLIVLKKVKNLC